MNRDTFIDSIYSSKQTKSAHKSISFNKLYSIAGGRPLHLDISTEEKKANVSGCTSPSYLMAMKALQDKVKILEKENQQLHSKLNHSKSSIEQQSQRSKVESLLAQITSNYSNKNNNDDQDRKIKELQNQIEINRNQYEDQLIQIRQEYQQKLCQADQRIRELMSDMDGLAQKLTQEQEINNTYKNKIMQLNSQIQKEKQQSLTNTIQLENFIKSSKILNETITKLNIELNFYKKDHQELQTYVEWYTQMYSVDSFNEFQKTIEQLTQDYQELDKKLEAQMTQNLNIQQDYQILKLQQERTEQINNRLQNELNMCKTIVRTNENKQSISIQYSKPSSPKKQQKLLFDDDIQNSFITRIKTKTNDDIPQITPKSKQQSPEFDSTEYENITKQIIKIELQLKELDKQYDQIEAQAQRQEDIKIKQQLRQQLIQLLQQIKELNLELSKLVNLQKQLKINQ